PPPIPRQVVNQCAIRLVERVVEQYRHGAQSVEGAAPPGMGEIGSDAVGGQQVMAEIAAMKLVERELVKEGEFGLPQVLRIARQLPQFQAEAQPIGLRAAF